jgi:hypothetical protein
MRYRRDSQGQRQWQEWVAEHKEALGECSLPQFVFSERLTWLRFLEHGGWHPQPRWSIRMLSPHQAKIFYDFIVSEYGTDQYRPLLRNLEDARLKPST